MLTLPALPPHVHNGVWQRDVDNERLEAMYPDLPRSSFDCPTCRGTETFRFYDDIGLPVGQRAVVDYECPRPDQFILQRYFRSTGLGDRYGKLWWADFDGWPQAAVELAEVYRLKMDDFFSHGMGLYLHGTHGVGKTGLAALLFKEALLRGYDGHWLTFADLLSRYEDTWRGTKEDRAYFDSRFRNVPLLVIDDMGREYEGRRTAPAAVDAILRTRIQLGLPTFVTTNLMHNDFLARYSEGVQSLVTEACVGLEFTGTNYRTDLQARTLQEITDSVRRPFTFG